MKINYDSCQLGIKRCNSATGEPPVPVKCKQSKQPITNFATIFFFKLKLHTRSLFDD